MTTTLIRTLKYALAISWLTTLALAGDQAADSLKKAREAVRRDARTREGIDWERQHAPWLGPVLTPLGEQCREDAPSGQDKKFTIYLRLSAKGQVVEVLSDSETPYAVCFRDSVARITFPRIPRDGYWFEIVMLPGPRRH